MVHVSEAPSDATATPAHTAPHTRTVGTGLGVGEDDVGVGGRRNPPPMTVMTVPPPALPADGITPRTHDVTVSGSGLL